MVKENRRLHRAGDGWSNSLLGIPSNGANLGVGDTDLEHNVVEINVSSASLAQEGLRNHGMRILEHANVEFLTIQEDIRVSAVKQAGKISNGGIIEGHTTVVT